MSLIFDRDWPNRELSRHLDVDGVNWHVQLAGDGPCVLLLHGTGASTHSFRDLLPQLARRFTVIAPDLPGHAFTRAPSGMVRSMPEMARAIGRLLNALELQPKMLVGHSAGAAIAVRLTLDGLAVPASIVSINGALLPFEGVAAFAFPAIAKISNALGFLPGLVAARSGRFVDDVLRQSGSMIDERGVELYRRLASEPSHVAGVIAMTAGWDLGALAHQLPRLPSRLVLVAGENDQVVPVERSRCVHARVPNSELIVLQGLGHLAHEENPAVIERIIIAANDASEP